MIIYCIVESVKGTVCPRVIEEIKNKEAAISRCKDLRRHKAEINAARKKEGKPPVKNWGVYYGDTYECMIGEKIF